MATNNLSYTNKDIADIRKALVNLVPKLTDKWTDFNESDLGMVLIELMASVGDLQNFYMDIQALETFLDTAKQDKNLRSLLRMMNYRVPLVKSAEGTVEIVFSNDTYKDITIPKYTTFYSSTNSTNIEYCSSEAVSIAGNFTNIEVPVMEGSVKNLTVTKEDLLSNYNSLGRVSRRVYLGYTTVADKSVTVVQNNTKVWKEVDDALLVYEGGKVYSVHKDSEGQVYLLMSANFLDELESNDSLSITFVISLGADGGIGADVLDTIGMTLEGVTRIYNPLKCTGGADEPNLQNLKLEARKNAMTMGRYVVLQDYEVGVKKNPSVAHCVVRDWKTPNLVSSPYLIKIWAVDYAGNSINEVTQKAILSDLTENGNIANEVEFIEVNNVTMDVDCLVYVNTKSEQEKVLLRQQIEAYIYSTFAPEYIDFGQGVSLSMLASTIRAMSDKIASINLKSPSSDVVVGETEFLKLGSIKIDVETVPGVH